MTASLHRTAGNEISEPLSPLDTTHANLSIPAILTNCPLSDLHLPPFPLGYESVSRACCTRLKAVEDCQLTNRSWRYLSPKGDGRCKVGTTGVATLRDQTQIPRFMTTESMVATSANHLRKQKPPSKCIGVPEPRLWGSTSSGPGAAFEDLSVVVLVIGVDAGFYAVRPITVACPVSGRGRGNIPTLDGLQIPVLATGDSVDQV